MEISNSLWSVEWVMQFCPGGSSGASLHQHCWLTSQLQPLSFPRQPSPIFEVLCQILILSVPDLDAGYFSVLLLIWKHTHLPAKLKHNEAVLVSPTCHGSSSSSYLCHFIFSLTGMLSWLPGLRLQRCVHLLMNFLELLPSSNGCLLFKHLPVFLLMSKRA